MALRTAEQYLASLRDGRRVWFRGERVDDVTSHPVIRRGAEQAALDFAMGHDPAHAALWTAEVFGARASRFYAGPACIDDLRARASLIEASTRHGRTIVPLVKEIGSDALFALWRIAAESADAPLRDKVEVLWRRAAHDDLALAVAQTDEIGRAHV